MIHYIKNLSDRTIVIVGTILLISSFISYFLFSKAIPSIIGFLLTAIISVLRVRELRRIKKQWDEDSFILLDKIEKRKKRK